jgi:hypothetical protein
MGYITDEHVADVNDRVAQALTTAQAFAILDGCTRTMVDKLCDLNGVASEDLRGVGIYPRRVLVAKAHGWDWNEREDDRPADGHGPCGLGRFEASSRSTLECRRCSRRKIDHRPV